MVRSGTPCLRLVRWVFSLSRLNVCGKTVKSGQLKKADYIFGCKPNFPPRVVEAKVDNLAQVRECRTHLAAFYPTSENLVSELT